MVYEESGRGVAEDDKCDSVSALLPCFLANKERFCCSATAAAGSATAAAGSATAVAARATAEEGSGAVAAASAAVATARAVAGWATAAAGLFLGAHSAPNHPDWRLARGDSPTFLAHSPTLFSMCLDLFVFTFFSP